MVVTDTGTTAPFSAISGASIFTLSEASGGLAIERLDRVGFALRLERIFRIFVVGGGEGRRQAERQIAEADQRDRARALQDQAPRGEKSVVVDRHPKVS